MRRRGTLDHDDVLDTTSGTMGRPASQGVVLFGAAAIALALLSVERHPVMGGGVAVCSGARTGRAIEAGAGGVGGVGGGRAVTRCMTLAPESSVDVVGGPDSDDNPEPAYGAATGLAGGSDGVAGRVPAASGPAGVEVAGGRAGASQAGTRQAEEAADDAPPVVGLGALVIFYSFLVVMLLVPFLMATRQAEPSRTQRGFAAPGAADTRRDERTGTGTGLTERASAEPGVAGQAVGGWFTSERERRLWQWTVVVLVAIWSTLGPVAELAAFLRESNLLRLTSGAVMLVVVAVFAVQWLKKRPGRHEVGAAIGIAAVYLATLIRLPVPEARSHLFEYGLVAMLIYHALVERRRNGRRVPVPPLAALLITALLGWVDEGIQFLLPNRAYDVFDVGFNALAALMAITATLFMTWTRRLDIIARIRRRAR